MNFASSFITFVEEHLIEDDNMKIILTGVRILSNSIGFDNGYRVHNEECTDGRKDKYD